MEEPIFNYRYERGSYNKKGDTVIVDIPDDIYKVRRAKELESKGV